MLSEESDLLYLRTGGSFIYSETNYVKQHEKSQGANAGREREKKREKRANLSHVTKAILRRFLNKEVFFSLSQIT